MILCLIVSFIILYISYDMNQLLTFDNMKIELSRYLIYIDKHPTQSVIIFFCIFLLVTGTSLPGAAVLALAAGGLFGFVNGVIIVSFASSIGATIAFFTSRTLLRNTVQNKFKNKLIQINKGIKKEGAFYLFGLRLVPLFPYFLINIIMGLTSINIFTFYWVSQLGMIPGTCVYVYSGTQLAKISSPSDIFSPSLITAFVMLGLFPLIAKRFTIFIRSKNILKVNNNRV